jgi:lysophospholipase L1-like esterase
VASLALAVLAVPAATPADAADRPPPDARRVVFLGDSITYAGRYVEYVEAVLRLDDPSSRREFLDLGLPSETVSGLTEPGHAGGQFPRPELRERLDRVLAKTKPDLVVACYGMNDGIYHPFDEGRFRKFQDGILDLRARAIAAGAKVLHLTPPVFDPRPIRAKTLPAGLAEYRQPFEGYDAVLGRYSEWLLARRADGWDVIDVHGPMKLYIDRERARDPDFRLADDGVHLNDAGHWLIARAILGRWGVPAAETEGAVDEVFNARPRGAYVLSRVRDKQRLLKDAWLTAVGHKRPGMKPGPPLDEAERRAAAIDAEIAQALAPKP